MSKKTQTSSSEDQAVVEVASEKEMAEAVEEAASKIAEIVVKHEAVTAMSKYQVGKAVWDVLKKRKDKNYLAGGDQLFIQVAQKVVEKTGADKLEARTLRSYVSLAKVLTKKEMEELLKLPKFAFSKLKAVFDLFNLGRVLQKGDDVEEAKAKAIEFLTKNAELSTHQLRQVHQDAMRPSGENQAVGGTGGGAGGGAGGGEVSKLPMNIHNIPQKITNSIDGLMDACGALTILLKDNGGPKFKSETKRDNFIKRLHEARATLVQVADTAEETIQILDKWETGSFQACVEKAPKGEKKSKEKSKKSEKKKSRKPVGKKQPPESTVSAAMDKAREAREKAADRHKKGSDKE